MNGLLIIDVKLGPTDQSTQKYMKNINTRIQERLVVSKTKSNDFHEGIWGDIEAALPDLENEMFIIVDKKSKKAPRRKFLRGACAWL